MNKESKKLGRGLSSLFSSGNHEEEGNNFKYINTSAIEANKDQPRKKFNKNEINDLAASIKSNGLLQPIVLRKKGESNYQIIAGERRWRAAQLAEIHQMPAIIKDMSDEEVLQAALIENIQREDLNPVEEAKAYEALLKNNTINAEQLSIDVGKSRSHISNTVRLLELDEKILNYIEEGRLSMGHARALIGVPNSIKVAEDIINNKLSVREVERNTAKHKKVKM